MNRSLGILGGLGPLASAEFLQTIYEFNLTDREQQSPTCILYSDPTFPDRTDAIFNGSDDLLVSLLIKSLESLCNLGVSKIVIVCVTMHYFLPKIPVPLRKKVISLIDVILAEVTNTKENHLLLCTNGTRAAKIFQNHEMYQQIEKRMLFPDHSDQDVLHNYIYKLKLNLEPYFLSDYLDYLVQKYQTNCFIAACTELHIFNKYLIKQANKQNYQVLDPLLIIAKKIDEFMNTGNE